MACLFLTIHLHYAIDKPSNYSNQPPTPRSHPQQLSVVKNNDGGDGGKYDERGHRPQSPRVVAGNSNGGSHAANGPPPRDAVNVKERVDRIGAAGAAASSSSEEGASACLLVNDENPRLPEWIAYHYLTLPLRSLIVAVDPASRSSPNEILMRWYEEMGLDVRPWTEKKYLPPNMRGPCTSDDAEKCLWHHRDRQQAFVMKCMSEFKRMNKTWVLLTDVDEYLVFNRIRDDDPAVPLDEAPEGVPTMDDWKWHNTDTNFPNRHAGSVDGYVDGKYTRSELIFLNNQNDTTIIYGSVVEDMPSWTEKGGAKPQKYFLRDDIAYHEATALNEAPKGVPTLREPWFGGTKLYVKMYNDVYDNNTDGSFVEIPMGWKTGDETMRKFYGGHLITDTKGRMYYMENEAKLWPPHYSARDAIAARKRLPSIGEGATILHVLERESAESYTNGAIGPCLSMPRLLYGSREEKQHTRQKVSPEGFDDKDFVTLRYRWHAFKGEFEASKYGKTIIDVSRIPYEALGGKALNIHRPLTYYCRKDPARYAMSFLRVNHYLDSFEAYSYRNDARASKRQCRECYDEKGKGAAVSMDNDLGPWLTRFVKTVGSEKAKKLLDGVGNFVKLS